MRTDPRYRQVLAVYRALDQPYLHATEGPGELRLGVRGMVRLYEYWVYLQVLQAAREMYGPLLEPGSTSSLSNNAEAAHDALNFPLNHDLLSGGRPHCV